MPTWRSLEDYSPFARVLITYMWEQRPPLLPSQFAMAMGVRKQQVSSWLTTTVVPDPPLVVQLARQMGLPVRDLLIAAGHATAADPLFDTADVWTYMRQHLAAAVRDRPITHEEAISAGMGTGMGADEGQEGDEREADEREASEDAASSAARLEHLLETLDLLERRQRFAARPRQMAPPPPPDSPILVASDDPASDDPAPDGSAPDGYADENAADVEGASTAVGADHTATPSAEAPPGTRARKGT